MRLLVSGSREYGNYALVRATLDDLHRRFNFTVLIHGGAKGVDAVAGMWAQQQGVCEVIVPYASAYGAQGGTKRNIWMLEYERPEFVVAFPMPTSRGTYHLIAQAKQRGLAIRIVPGR